MLIFPGLSQVSHFDRKLEKSTQLGLATAVLLLLGSSGLFAANIPPGPGSGHTVKLLTQHGYLPAVPVLVRVELRNPDGQREVGVWDIDATLSADRGVTPSTNRILLRNGLGSALVTFSGGGDFS